METAAVAFIVLSPEFVALKWLMKELMHFLYRRERCGPARTAPVVIPVFYRLNVTQLYDGPPLDRKGKDDDSLYQKSGFCERLENEGPEANIGAITAALQAVHGIMGVRNDIGASNDCLMDCRWREICDNLTQNVPARSVKRTAIVTPGRALSHLGKFCGHLDTPFDTSELLFDYDSEVESGDASTQELLQQLLDLDTWEPPIRASSRGTLWIWDKEKAMPCVAPNRRQNEHFDGGWTALAAYAQKAVAASSASLSENLLTGSIQSGPRSQHQVH